MAPDCYTSQATHRMTYFGNGQTPGKRLARIAGTLVVTKASRAQGTS